MCGGDGKCLATAVANAGYTIGDSADVETLENSGGEHILDYGGPSGDAADASIAAEPSASSG